MAEPELDSDQLLQRAGEGDLQARQQLLMRHQKRLRQMIALRMDHRLTGRVDPSDIVQETMAKAVEQLSDYLERQPIPFYPWLRQLAWERLIELHRQHVQARKRSVRREEHLPLSNESVMELASRLMAKGSRPSARLHREELRNRVQAALARLPEHDREVLVLRHLEFLTPREIAAVLNVTEGVVYTRHLRALERLRKLLGTELMEGEL